MALTSVADTRLLVFLEFPATKEMGTKTRDFFEKELRERLFAPSIVLTEFVKIAGEKIGEEAAKNRLRILKGMGMQTLPLDEENALAAGSLLLSCRKAPIADAIIASYVKTGFADYAITDDQHFKTLSVKTKWL